MSHCANTATTTGCVNRTLANLLPALTPGGTAQIKGKVTSAATSEPIEGIEVCASDEAAFECRETSASGEYDISGLPAGSYTVLFGVPFERHLSYLYQYYNDRTSAAEATPVVLATGATAAGINAAMHSGGQITGKVTDAVTKAAVEGIEVCAIRRGSGEFVEGGCAPSNASGEYDVVGLFSGEYTVSFRLPFESSLNYLTQYYNGKAAAGEANPVAVTAGSTTPKINAALNKGGQITGKVTDASTKAGVAEIQVCAYNGPEGSGRCSRTNGSGEYNIGGLATGEYRVEFLPPFGGNLNYLRQYYNGKASSGEAEPVSVTVGSSTPNINAALLPGGKITGKVTAAASKEALSEVQVCASENSGEFFNQCTQTNVSGEYTMQGLPSGHYTVVFSSFAGPYAAQYYNNKVSASEAEAVSVTAGATTPNINAAMQLGAEITGKVTDANTKAPVAGIQVCPQAAGAYVGTGCVSTDENGNYALTDLPATEYRIEFAPYYNSNLNYLRQYYNGKSSSAEANLVAVTPGSKTPEINAALHPGGQITGSVSAAASKAKLANIYVCANESGGEFINHCTQTNEHGEYAVGGLPSGNYTVSFLSFTGEYAPQYYNGVPQYFEATSVAVVAGSATPNINAALAVAAEIKGSVTDAVTKAHLATIDVCALVAATDTVARCEYTNSNGEYTLRPLAAGEYKVQFAPAFGSTANYTTQYYNDKPTFAAGEVVMLAAGGSATNINAALHEAGKITGKVTDAATTLAVEGIEVCAQTSTGEYVGRCGATNASGEYAVTELNTGEYKLYFTANGHNYLPQYYNGKKSLAEGELVAVTLGSTTPGINVAMQPGGKITGKVTGIVSKSPIQAISVCAFPKSGGIVSCANTNSSGEYAIIALTTGEYIVDFTGAGQNYVSQYYNGKATYGEAEAVSVTAGATHENVNAALEVGGEITGLVTAAKTTAPLASVQAEAYKSNGEYIAAAPTNAKGEYTIVGLPTGELKVAFYSFTQEYKTQYYKEKESFAEATGVPTTAGGHVTPNINAALLIEPPVLISLPTISGAAVEGHKLTEAHGSWKNEPTEYTDQWLRCNSEGQGCESIEGASKQEYVPVFADVGHELRVKETAHNEGGPGGPVTSEPTAPVAVAPPENTKVPSITGTAQQGKTLNEVAGKWTNEPTKAKYQWLRCNEAGAECKAVATAIASSYPVTEEDVGHTLRVEETAENAAGPGSPATSAQTEVVVPPIPVNTAPPTITGTAQQGKQLTAHHGGWKYSPTKYKLQWFECEKLGKGCLPITGATGETYVPGPLEVGGTIRVEEAATNAGGTSEYVTSEPTAEVLPAPPVNTSAPTLTGTAQQGKELTEHHGAWENNPTSYKVEWLRCNKEGEECSPFSTTSEEKYVPEAIDVGHTIRVSEVAKNAGESSKPALSTPTAVVVPPVPVLEVLPTITGTPKQGDKLTRHHGKWSNTPSGYQDQWLRCNEAGKECEATGASGEMYELTSKDVKHKLRVEEIAENEGGPSQPATSEPTGVVVSSVPEIESPPTITGTAQQGKELTGHHGKWTNEPTGYADTWVRCNEAGKECESTGATGENYVPVAKDVGHTLRVEEIAHNEGGPSSPALSEPTAVVLPLAPTDVTPPTVTGEALQGKTLTEHHGNWEPKPTGYKLQWLQCEETGEGCLPIGGANGETYKPTSLDLGHTIRVEETASNTGGTSEKSAVSEPTAVVKAEGPVNITPPSIAGTAQKGQTLAEQHGSWTNEPTSFTYQWLRCSSEGTECNAIAGAVDPTYKPITADIGHTLEVSETAINAGGESTPATSAHTAVVQPVPLNASGGENLSATAGVAVNFDGTGSTPADEIEKYHWEFGDGKEAEGKSVSHAYASPGAYTAKLTVSRGTEHASSSITVVVSPAPAHSATVEVTDSAHNPLSGATVLYIGPANVRIEAATKGEGKAALAGLPEGTDTVYAYKSGFQPAVGHVAVSGGAGETTVALPSGEIATSTLKSHEMTLKEIEEAGINVNDPANQNVYEFEVRLAFIETPEEPSVTFHCYINKAGEFVGGCTGDGGGGGGGWGGFGGGGGGPGCSPHECVGGGIVAIPHVVEGHPLIQWLVLRGKVTVLKQFFEVSQVIQNLSPEPFKIAAGSTTLNIPSGMSLAPTATPQSATQTVPAIAGNGSATTNWIVRGDKPGYYLLSANYNSKLEPFEAPFELEARLATPLHVWGVEALSLSVQADEGFLAEGRPYHVRVGVTNKSDITLNNVAIEIFSGVHEHFIFEPDQPFGASIAELKPGETIYAPVDILVPDAASEAAFNPKLSSVHFVGEEIKPGVGIEAVKPPPLYELSALGDTANKVHLRWTPSPQAEAYEVFSTPTLNTPFPVSPDPVINGNGEHVTKLAGSATEAYVPAAASGKPIFYAVTSIIKGVPTLDHPVIPATPSATSQYPEVQFNTAHVDCETQSGKLQVNVKDPNMPMENVTVSGLASGPVTPALPHRTGRATVSVTLGPADLPASGGNFTAQASDTAGSGPPVTISGVCAINGVLGLGDSVAAGYGLGPSTNYPDNPDAYPAVLGRELGQSAANYSVEGECATNNATLEPNCKGKNKSVNWQLTQVPKGLHPSVVTLTVGADDIKFADCFKEAFLPPHFDVTLSGPNDPCNASHLGASTAALQKGVEEDLKTITTRFTGARVEVVNYYNPLPPAPSHGSGPCIVDQALEVPYSLVVSHEAVRFVAEQILFHENKFNAAAGKLQGTLYSSAQRVLKALNHSLTAAAVKYHDSVVTPSFKGHDICASGQEWVFGPTFYLQARILTVHKTLQLASQQVCPDPIAGSGDRSFRLAYTFNFGANELAVGASTNCLPHPTEEGQEVIARDVLSSLRAPPGAATVEASATPARRTSVSTTRASRRSARRSRVH